MSLRGVQDSFHVRRRAPQDVLRDACAVLAAVNGARDKAVKLTVCSFMSRGAMNTRGCDSSWLLASYKSVGILRPNGDTQAPAMNWHQCSTTRRRCGRSAPGRRLPLRLGRRACRNRGPASLIISTSWTRPRSSSRLPISPRCSTSTRRGSAGGSPSWAVVHPRADAARDGRIVLLQAQKACTREPALLNAPVAARGERP